GINIIFHLITFLIKSVFIAGIFRNWLKYGSFCTYKSILDLLIVCITAARLTSTGKFGLERIAILGASDVANLAILIKEAGDRLFRLNCASKTGQSSPIAKTAAFRHTSGSFVENNKLKPAILAVWDRLLNWLARSTQHKSLLSALLAQLANSVFVELASICKI
ncbi:MAG: hypothetical protein ACP5JE_01325, partial [Thermoplasmata archaeon]